MYGAVGGLMVLLVVIVIFLIAFFNFVPLSLWISATASGVRISIATLVGMRFRRIKRFTISFRNHANVFRTLHAPLQLKGIYARVPHLRNLIDQHQVFR